MKDLERLKEAMFNIVDKSSTREEDFSLAVNAGKVFLDAICAGRYPVDKDEAEELRARMGRLEASMKDVRDMLTILAPAAALEKPEPTASVAEPIRVGPPDQEAKTALKS